MSSLAGLIPLKFLGSYASSKAALITLSDVLKKELKELNSNIKVVLVEPGLYYTGFNQVMFENKYDMMKSQLYIIIAIVKTDKKRGNYEKCKKIEYTY